MRVINFIVFIWVAIWLTMATDQNLKYIAMENVLQKINTKYISLDEEETKRNSKILDAVTQQIIEKMKQKNPLFKSMYEKFFYGGSYYDKLKISKPEEYDLDILLNLPTEGSPHVQISDRPGFVHILVNKSENLYNPSTKSKKFNKYDDFLVDSNYLSIDNSNYLSIDKLLTWFESLVTKALEDFEIVNKRSSFAVNLNDQQINVVGYISKSHPAFTLKLECKELKFKLDIDLVPCFQFTESNWPQGSYRSNPYPLKKTFLVVPKKPHLKEKEKLPGIEKYWRLSFQEQERYIMTGKGFKFMKPALKLLKKLKDKHHSKISSYFIKTIFLWKIQKEDHDFWNQPLSIVFMKMLEYYEECIRLKRIDYYWNSDYNLIGHIKGDTLTDISNFLKNMIKKIDRTIDHDPFIVATYLVSEDEVNNIRDEVKINKKYNPLNTIDDITENGDISKIVESIESLNVKMTKLIEFQCNLERRLQQMDDKIKLIDEKVSNPQFVICPIIGHWPPMQ